MPQQHRTLLIVDDSPEDRELYRRYLECDDLHDDLKVVGGKYSYRLVEATLGQQGLDLWQQHQPDAVLLDYRLPDLDGLEFLAQLRLLIQQSGLPMVCLPISLPVAGLPVAGLPVAGLPVAGLPTACLPVIVVTGQGNEAIAVQAMKAGAQDYLIKGQITAAGLRLAVDGVIESVQLRTQLQQRIEREHVIRQMTQQIHRSLHLDEVLQTTVTEVRQFLRTDRVLVFRLEPDGNGTVVAESVGSAWRSLLSSTLYDPCLAESHLKSNQLDDVVRYRQGQVTAIADIYDGSINPCHAGLLAQFQVKANLVVPILHDDQFWGLLIVHHCVTPRSWQPLEIDLLKELATQVGIALRQAELYQQAQDELAERRQVDTELLESQAQLQQQLAEIEAIYQNAPIGLGILDRNLRFVRINQRLAEMNGYSVAAHLGRTIRELLPDLANDAEEILHPILETGEPRLNIEIRGETPAQPGVPRIWLEHFLPLKHDERVIGISVVCEEITDRKQTEAVLRQSEERYRTLFESMNEGFCVIEMLFNEQDTPIDYRFLEINPVFEQQTGLHQAEGQTARQLLPDLESHWFEIYGQVALTGKSARFENGSSVMNRWFDVSAFRIGQPESRRVAILFRDISEAKRDEVIRKQAAEALRQSEERYRCLAELIPQLVWTANAEGLLLDVNQRWSDFTGLTLEQVRILGWEQVVHPEDLPVLSQQWTAAMQQGTLYQAEGRIQRANGAYRWHLHQAMPQKNEQNQIVRWFGTATDIEAQKQLEAERDRLLQLEQTARQEAERVNRIKDEFLAVLSHELRSPLNPILGWTKLLQSHTFDETKTAQALATIERNAKLQSQLIDDLLDIAKILRGKLSINAAPVNLIFVMESAIDTVKTAALSKSIQIYSSLSPIGQVSGDAARLQQVVWNLLSNAVKFTPPHGRVDIRLDQVGDQAQMTVRDTGKGINPDFLPHLFESFRQEDASTSRRFGGLGLGLAIVRQLVEAHGGTITADSAGEDLGATFRVWLPLLKPQPEIRPIAAIARSELDLTGIRILSVDDEPDTRELLTVLLTQCGAEVLIVASASAVLATLESFQPDVFISDIGMPEVDGYTLIQQIRALPVAKGGQVKAIALTAYAREEDYQRSIASGYQRHMTKPIELDLLVRAVLALARGTL